MNQMNQMPFQSLFEYSSIGIIISNQEGVIERANLYASNIFGYESQELIGKKIEILIPEHLRRKHVGDRKMYNDNPQPRTMGSNLNLMAVKKNGDQFPVEISLSFFEVDGHRKVVSFVNDITLRKKSEDELKKLTEELESKVKDRTLELSNTLLALEQTNLGLHQEMEQRKNIEAQMRSTLEKEKELSELKSRFVSMASHEFRTPLSGILTSASLIDKYCSPEDGPKRAKHIKTIKKSVKNLTILLNDFLSLDKINQGKVISRPSHFSLNDLINEIIEGFKILSEKEQDVVVDFGNTFYELYQDREMLRNVIMNLLSNACKYSFEKSIIELNIKQFKGRLFIEIKDYGIGVPKEDQQNLFDLFFRAQNVNAIQGTGLGLSIVKRYLDMMGGEIEFTSTENVGSIFSVIFPAEIVNHN